MLLSIEPRAVGHSVKGLEFVKPLALSRDGFGGGVVETYAIPCQVLFSVFCNTLMQQFVEIFSHCDFLVGGFCRIYI